MGSCTNRSHPSGPENHLLLQHARTELVSPSMLDLLVQDVLSIPVQASLEAVVVRPHIPMIDRKQVTSFGIHLEHLLH